MPALSRFAAGAALCLTISNSTYTADLAQSVEEKYKPRSDAHAVYWDYTLLSPFQGASLRYAYSLNSWFAYALGGRTLVTLANESGASTRYLFSVMPVSQFIFRYPVIVNNFWRPYFVSELNYLYQFSDGRDMAGIAGKSGVEFFASQNFAIAFEAGVQLPFYRNTNASLPTGGIISVIGAWYF
ncbi:MAG: hypothetical protein U1F27_13100 [Turneriella sp.]